MKRFAISILFLGLLYCSGESEFTEITSSQSARQADKPEDSDLEAEQGEEVPGEGQPPQKDPATQDSAEDEQDPVVAVDFEFDNSVPPDKLVDYVFVLDNSNSMATAHANARAGIRAIVDAKVFNSNARIASMSTMPAAFSGEAGNMTVMNQVHGGVVAHPGARVEPGFLTFATEAAREAYLAVENTSNFSLAYCDEFFDPYANHADGHSCIDAGLQTAFKPVGIEDGIMSFYHMILHKGSTKVFRDNAEVNVIFVSDVQAPGAPHHHQRADLYKPQNRPTFDQIVDAINVANSPAKITFHGIVPNRVVRNCTENADQFSLGYSYNTLVLASGGKLQDVCSTEGYQQFFKDMVEEAQSPSSYTFELSNEAAKILEVIVNGKAVDSFTYNAEARKLTVDLTALPTEKLAITVKYQK